MEREFVFRSANLPQSCFKFFADMRNQDKLCDIKFTVGEQCISAHHMILAAAIPLFRKALFKEEELAMPKIEPSVFECLIDYVYTCELKITMGNVKNLLEAACFLRMKDVRDACCGFLSQGINPENVLYFKDLADDLNLTELKEFTDLYIKEHFEGVSNTDKFLHCPFEYVRELIGKDDLNVDSEEKVLESVLRWVKASVSDRKENLPELLRNVRMVLLKPLYLTDVAEREELIRTCLASRDLVDEARNYNLFPERKKAMCSFSTEIRRFMEIRGEETGNMIYSLHSSTKYTVMHLDLVRESWSTKFAQETWANYDCFAILNNVMYFFGDYTFAYDPARNKSRFLQSLTLSRKAMAAVSLGNNIFVCGGFVRDHVASNAVECFNPEKNEYTTVTPLLKSRWGLNAVSLGNYIYVLGGKDKNQTYDTVERHNFFTAKWQYTSRMLTSRSFFSSAVLNGKIYVCGGCTSITGTECMATAEVFDPITNKWKFISPMSTSRSMLKLVVFYGKLYAIGGNNSNGKCLNFCEAYDTEVDEWTYHMPLHSFLRNSATVVL